MRVYWRKTKKGQRLVLNMNEGDQEEEIGGVRQTKRGFDAFAKTFGYEPGRALKGIPTMEEAKTFVEDFEPWTLYGGEPGLVVEPEVVCESG